MVRDILTMAAGHEVDTVFSQFRLKIVEEDQVVAVHVISEAVGPVEVVLMGFVMAVDLAVGVVAAVVILSYCGPAVDRAAEESTE